MKRRSPLEARHPLFVAILAATALAALSGCASWPPDAGNGEPDCNDVYENVGGVPDNGAERNAYLEREVARLKADLAQAEAAMVNIESGLRGTHTRADAVSLLAESRIAVQRVSRTATWRKDELREANLKLTEAERQLQAGRSGSAVFFASRAQRIAESLQDEVDRVSKSASARFIRARKVNLRAGPSTEHMVIAVLTESTPVFTGQQRGSWIQVRTLSGPTGWVHGDLLRPR